MSASGIRAAPGWTGAVIGLLVGLLVGATWLFLRERGADAGELAGHREAPMQSASTESGGDADPARPVDYAETSGTEDISQGRRTAIVRATDRVAPAVVSINVIEHRIFRDRRMDIWEQFFPGMFPRREFQQDIQSLGSGFILSEDGYVVTNYHVVEGGDEIIVILSDGREFAAQILEVVPRFDLALLKIDGRDLPTAPLAQMDDLQIGEWAIAIGSPFGYLLADTQPTVTVGVISALNRDIKRSDRDRVYLGMIQTDAAINPGNSGGPLVDADGRVIGINTFIFTESGGSIGIGFAVPIARVRWLVDEVRVHGRYREPYIGFWVQKLSPNLARALNLNDTVGFVVREVEENSPAWKAGLRVWDVIREIDGVPLQDADTVTRLWYETEVGTELTMAVEREGRQFTSTIQVEESPRSRDRRRIAD